ncbi:Amidase [Ancylobacter novellus DSM 506]|uniref:Amidase n=1 Tax=Ancylobacter novellus (strain ATCC 8093 / DSM 506 / JCM 20403 / CCM 1077 / IAM 12100 / NBRC 12443 / NCIMB 10456) TaxID=639283 RepID=D7A2E9_ANCN5|nr:amidase [Ancylobacter novellus]ADH89612.1 Amidase [Ancylobacter novellus DSM 506]
MTEMLSAAALAQAVRAGRLTPADVAERCAEAIRAQEGEVRAFASLDLDALTAKATSPGLAETPLAGLPVGIKDILDTVDFPTERGSPLYAGYRPATDAAIVRMTARAGGLMAGKTVTTEFAFMQPSPTRNPRRLSHSPGGSSAGSAAAVAAGMLPVTIGTQTGGSVIRPASYCGVTGYKPSYKMLPVLGLKPFSWSLDTLGLFGAHVADVAFAAGAISGRDFALDHDANAPRIAVAKTARAHLATEDAHAALEQAARAAERAGASVTVVDLSEAVEKGDEAHAAMQGYEAALALAHEWDHHREALSPTLGTYLEEAMRITPEQYDAGRRLARQSRHALSDLFADYDALLTFSATGEAPEGFATTGSPAFNRLWTMSGAPCINVTGLTGATGLPIGVQLVGRFGRDRALLEAARFLERAIGA